MQKKFEFFRQNRIKRPDLYESKKWRLLVLRRDKRKCKRCGCSTRKELQVHHIKRYQDYPHLRSVVDNGITLCKKCHAQMKGNEEGWENLCNLLIGNKDIIIDVANLIRKEKLRDEENNE